MADLKCIFSTKRTVLLWAAAVVVAVGGGTAAVAASGPDRDVLTQNDVRNQLAADDSASPAPRTSSSDARPSDQRPRILEQPIRFDSAGGWVQVVCADGNVYLRSWSPKPGYRADHVARGPARSVSVEFESDTADDVTVVATCGADGKPQIKATADPDDHGDDDGDDRGRGRDDDSSGHGSGGGDDNSGRDHPEDD